MQTNLEKSASSLNSLYFLPEFTFANTTFTPHAGTELELADGVIWLDDIAVVFQMKERTSPDNAFTSSIDRWFQKKVLRDATKQIRDTIKYLNGNKEIRAENGRGQSVILEAQKLKTLHKVVLYSEPTAEYATNTHHISSTAGFIHLLPLTDYDGLVRTLCTPSELFEYLSWRETILTRWEASAQLPEQALVGHYLWGDIHKTPSIHDIRYLFSMEEDIESFELIGILHKFIDRTYDNVDREDTRYHRIIGEVAKLNRGELRKFKERFRLALNKAKENVFTLPYRFSIPRNDCGFIFIPLEEEFRKLRRNALQNWTHAHKYTERLSKCLGIVFLRDPDGRFTIDWCILDAPWQEDFEMETMIKNLPLRPTKAAKLDRYHFAAPTTEG